MTGKMKQDLELPVNEEGKVGPKEQGRQGKYKRMANKSKQMITDPLK